MFFDRPDAGERALLVHCDFFSAPNHSAAALSAQTALSAKTALSTQTALSEPSAGSSESTDQDHTETVIEYAPGVTEFFDLARSAGVDPIDLVSARRKKPTPKFFIGTGKVEEIKALVEQHNIDVVMFNHALSPSQERNLE
ncbi:hypothetical protein N9L91_03690, partial [Pseudomonadales bacterium]|nr:hypothetical protein [Pseudomonadales bacterium]